MDTAVPMGDDSAIRESSETLDYLTICGKLWSL